MTGKHELIAVLFFMPSIEPVESSRVNQSKGVMIYGKSEKGIQGTDGERSDQLWKKDGSDAPDLGIMVSEAGI